MELEEEELPLPSFLELFGEGPLQLTRKRKRFSRDSEESSGRWTQEEHRLFLEGIKAYGKDWKKMQPLIKTRSLVQIRTHAQKVFKKLGVRTRGDPARVDPDAGVGSGASDDASVSPSLGQP